MSVSPLQRVAPPRSLRARTLPKLVHVRSALAETADETDSTAIALDVLRHQLQSGTVSPTSEVLFNGLSDWTPAVLIPELWISPPPTVPDDNDGPISSARRVMSGPATDSPRRGGSLAILGAMVGVLLFLGVGGLAVYYAYFYYRPVAIAHLPRRCSVAARLDLAEIVKFAPFKGKILPGLEVLGKTGLDGGPMPLAGNAPALKERLKLLAGINLDRDVREIAVCVFPEGSESRSSDETTKSIPKLTPIPAVPGRITPAVGPDPLSGARYVVAIGGRIRSGAIAGIYEALRSESFGALLRLEGTGDSAMLRVVGLPMFIGQADDGTLIIAATQALLASAREAKPEEEALANTNLQRKGAIEIVADRLVLSVLKHATPPKGLDPTVFELLSHATQLRVELGLGDTPRIEAALDFRAEGDARAGEKSTRKLLEWIRDELSKKPKDWAGEHAAIGAAKAYRDEAVVKVKLDFPFADVDRGATEFEKQLGDPKSTFRGALGPPYGVAPKPSASASASASGSASGPPGSPSAAPSDSTEPRFPGDPPGKEPKKSPDPEPEDE